MGDAARHAGGRTAAAHQFLSTAAVGFASFHGLVLMAIATCSSRYAIVAPFASSYDSLFVACGQLAFWMAFVHGLALGSKSATLWATVVYLGTAAPVIFLSLLRGFSTRRLHGLHGRD